MRVKHWIATAIVESVNRRGRHLPQLRVKFTIDATTAREAIAAARTVLVGTFPRRAYLLDAIEQAPYDVD